MSSPAEVPCRLIPFPVGTNNLAARVIHFGVDDCHRLMVLRSAGFSVDIFSSLGQLRTFLLAGGEADVLFLSDSDDGVPEDAMSLARTHSSAPVVLFRSTNQTYQESRFDLVVHALTPPEVWLHQVNALIARSRGVRARSVELPRKSARLRHEAAILTMRSRAERQRSRAECDRNAGLAHGEEPNPHSPSE